MVTKDSKGLSECNLSTKTGITETQTCHECGSARVIFDHENNEIVCMNCGFIVNQKIVNKKSEKKNCSDKQEIKNEKASTSLTYTVHDMGLETVIDWHYRDIYGKNNLADQKIQVYRLRGWQRRIRVPDSAEHNLAVALSEITKMANNLNTPKNILETASTIYQKAVKEQIIRGRSIQSVAAATLYLAYKQCGLPLTLEEITQTTTVNKKEVSRDYRYLIKKLDFSTLPLQLKSTHD